MGDSIFSYESYNKIDRFAGGTNKRFSKRRVLAVIILIILSFTILWSRHLKQEARQSCVSFSFLPITPPTHCSSNPIACLQAESRGPLVEKGSIVVATYNIWNNMFGWEVRKLHVAELIQNHLPDFVALQEVGHSLCFACLRIPKGCI